MRKFKTESKKLLDLMINSIYTNREIFLRELISNASDAVDKLYFRSLTDSSIQLGKDDLEIRVAFDKDARTITVSDSGVGMTEEELEKNLGTIAHSGSQEFKAENDFSETDAADIIGDLPYEKAEKLLQLMGMDEETTVRALLGYKEETAGGIMTTDFVSINDDLTVQDAIDAIRAMDEDQESVHYLYAVSDNGVLTGVMSLRMLVVAQPMDALADIMTTELITCPPELDQEECAEIISKYDLLALPVVDEHGVMLGVVTIDDAMDVMEEEHEEDLQQRSITSPWALGIIAVLLIIIGVLVFMLNR
jgi:CBS domain-containing protein